MTQAVAECRDLVKAEIESHLHHLLALRDSDPSSRAVDAVREVVPV